MVSARFRMIHWGWKRKGCFEWDSCFSMTLCFIKPSKISSTLTPFHSDERWRGSSGRHIAKQFRYGSVIVRKTLICVILIYRGSGVKGNKIITKYKFPSKSSAWRECVNVQHSTFSFIAQIRFSSFLSLNTLFISGTCWWCCYLR